MSGLIDIDRVTKNTTLHWILLSTLFLFLASPAARVIASVPKPQSAPLSKVTPFDLIVAMNTLRASYGHPALVEDPIIDAVAQATAETMAAKELSWHIGNVSGRVAAAGYGGGAKVWATENFAMGHYSSIDQIMLIWSDAAHMLPATNGAYCNIGAGEAVSPNGYTYYVLQAAYVAGKDCGTYTSSGGSTNPQVGSTTGDRAGGVSQLIVPVQLATPGPDGKIYHIVQAGQSFWAIAIAYKITIQDLKTWNNLNGATTLQIGQKLFIPSSDTVGFATPTPPWMVQVSPPDKDGKIIHVVQAYQTLSTISQAYGVPVNTILALNGLQVDWPLQIGQKLLINPGTVTPSPTPRPLTPLEKLTPASDGNYYHIVQSGETLAWIAGLYGVNLYDLMAWNGMSNATILQPGDKLLLKVTPPATKTPIPSPTTITATQTLAPPTPTATASPTATLAPTPSATPIIADPTASRSGLLGIGLVGLAVAGLIVLLLFSRKKAKPAG